MSRATRFLRACRREPVDCTPIWLMRQAGRYMPEYRALRKKHSLLEMIRAPELAAEVTLQPVNAFDVDAAILFADILPLLACVGQDVEFISGQGPVFANPIRHANQVPTSLVTSVEDAVGTTLDTVALVSRELAGRVPLIGFSGAPFTLACYAIEGSGSKDYARAKQFMYSQPEAWQRLMERLTEAITLYLQGQAERGADALQIFDSWAGCLSPHDYERFVLPHTATVVRRLKPLGIPIIHYSGGTGGMLPLIRRLDSTVVGVDWRTNLSQAWDLLGGDCAIQGNLDPVMLLAGPDTYRRGASRILDAVQDRPGHIFNLGHGVFKETPPEHVQDLVDFVHQASART